MNYDISGLISNLPFLIGPQTEESHQLDANQKEPPKNSTTFKAPPLGTYPDGDHPEHSYDMPREIDKIEYGLWRPKGSDGQYHLCAIRIWANGVMKKQIKDYNKYEDKQLECSVEKGEKICAVKVDTFCEEVESI